MRFRLVTFDVHHTLIRVKGSPGQQYAKIAKTYGIDCQAEALDATFPKVWQYMKKEYPIHGVKQGLTSRDWWNEAVTRVFLSAGVFPENDTLVKIGNDAYSGFVHASRWEVLPHSYSVLEFLKQNGLHLAVISNFDERLQQILQNLELLHFFDFIVTSHERQVEKPDPQIFKYAVKKAGVEMQEALHIGDNIDADYWGARKVGMEALLLNVTDKLKESDLQNIDKTHVLQDINELKNFIKRSV